jgi:hypothetical protein
VVEEEEEDVFAPADAITVAPAQLAGSRRSLKPIMLGLAILTIAALGLGYWFGTVRSGEKTDRVGRGHAICKRKR